MEFLGVGWQEALVVGLLMLIVVGPDRMPEVAYHVGRWVRRLQLYARAVRDEFREEFDYLETEYKTLQTEMQDTAAEFKAQGAEFDAELRRSTAEITDAAKSVERTVKDTNPAGSAKPGTNGRGSGATTNGRAALPAKTGDSASGAEPEPERKTPVIF